LIEKRVLIKVAVNMKFRIVLLLVTLAAGLNPATAQNSQGRSSTAQKDPLQTATNPLTPKSAMPAQHKSTAVAPLAAKNGENTTAELTHLEQQNIKARTVKGTSPAKNPAAAKTAGTPAANNSKINFKYQKPVGGLQATTPNASAKNSSTPRVTKSN
jgi:hypothetical protein